MKSAIQSVFAIVFLLCIPINNTSSISLYTDEYHTTRVRLTDSISNNPVSYADIYNIDQNIYTKSNSDGEITLNLSGSDNRITIKKFGYQSKTFKINSKYTDTTITISPVRIQKKFRNEPWLKYDVLLKRAIEKFKKNGEAEDGGKYSSKLVYCRIWSAIDTTLNSLFESYANMKANRYNLKGFKSEITRFASSEDKIPGISGNELEFKIDRFIRIPFFVEKYIIRRGCFEQDGKRIAMIGIGSTETETMYYINIADTTLLYINNRIKSGRRIKLSNPLQTKLVDRINQTVITLSTDRKDHTKYSIDHFIQSENYTLKQKNLPDKSILKTTLFDVIPDSSQIIKNIGQYVFNESKTEIKRQINFKASYVHGNKPGLFENEIQNLLLKPYQEEFWKYNTLIKPTFSEEKQIQSWEDNNQFHSEKTIPQIIEINRVDSVVNIMNNNMVPVEKVYIETDRSNYFAGDTIWFSAFVTDNIFLDSASLSKILYVDLINPDNKLETHLKLLISNGRTKGDFTLRDEIKNGLFRIRAYTQWMRNFQSEYLFEKTIPVYQTNTNDMVVIKPVINRSEQGDSVDLYLYSLLPLKYKSLDKQMELFIRINDSLSIKKSYNFKEEFRGSLGFFVPDSLNCSFADLKLTLSDTAVISEQRLSIPLKPGINISFYPESGKMVDGINTIVAYKAVDDKGNPVEFEADIIDENENIITHISEGKSGIGKFQFTPFLPHIYKAAVTSYGNKYLSGLPVTEPKGYILNFDADSSILTVKNNFYGANNTHFILISSRGVVYTSMEIKSNNKILRIPIQLNQYPKGIVQITLFDNYMRPLAERLVFNNKTGSKMQIHLSTLKGEYKKREKVELIINVTDKNGNPVNASFAVSVVDASITDSTQNNSDIESYLYLFSELKGDLNYNLVNLSDTTPQGRQNLDLVMQTQGWRNYLWNSVRYSNEVHNPLPAEKGFYIDGKIRSSNNKLPENNYKLNILDFKSGFNDVLNVNEYGRFKIDIPLCYGTRYLMIQNRNKKEKIENLRYTVDTLPVPEILAQNNELPYIPYRQSYLTKLEETVSLQDMEQLTDEKSIMIPEVVIKAKYKPYYETPAKTLNLEQKDPTGQKYSSLFQMISEEFGEKAFIAHGFGANGKYYPPILVVNGVPMTAEYCPPCYGRQYPWATRIPVNEISNVKFYEAGGDYSQFLTPPPPPPIPFAPTMRIAPIEAAPKSKDPYTTEGHIYASVVSFTTYSIRFRGNPTGAIVFPFQGIYQAKEFYCPVYESNTINKPDNRTTIYWNPEINTDSTGQAKISFYNSDLNGRAIIKISGVSYEQNDVFVKTTNYLSN